MNNLRTQDFPAPPEIDSLQRGSLACADGLSDLCYDLFFPGGPYYRDPYLVSSTNGDNTSNSDRPPWVSVG